MAGQYEVKGALAHGGLGWIYLAATATSTTAGSCSRASSTPTTPPRSRRPGAERQFLAQLSHPGIVAIHNFVRHVEGDGAEADYIVMAYIGGSTLSRRVAQPGDRRRAAAVAHALAYMIEILPALGYLHAGGASTATSSRTTSCSASSGSS